VWCPTLDSISQNLCTQTPHTNTQSHRNTIHTHDDTVYIVYSRYAHMHHPNSYTHHAHIPSPHVMHTYTIRIGCNNQQPPQSAGSHKAYARCAHVHYPNSYTRYAHIHSLHLLHTYSIRICNVYTRYARIHYPNLLQQLLASRKCWVSQCTHTL